MTDLPASIELPDLIMACPDWKYADRVWGNYLIVSHLQRCYCL
ncbi:hypothetical protein [Oscillatoria nigro-viridis]|nr:hypothetical protein [Oscillatoria nigro-viridis]